MVNFYEYANLASHIYDPSVPTYKLTKRSFIDKKSSGWYLMEDVDLAILPTQHFYAALYLKFANGVATDAVVAIRGTVFNDITNLLADAFAWSSDVLGDGSSVRFPNKPVEFLNLAVHFVLSAQEYVDNYFPTAGTLSLTGHSLGGALAQLVAVKTVLGHFAVTFNAPGIGHMPGVTTKQQGWIKNINARYDLISKIGLTLGQVNLINVPEKAAEMAMLFTEFDGKDFNEANNLYYWHQDMSAFTERVYSLLKSASTTESWFEVQQQQAYCLKQFVKQVFYLSPFVAEVKYSACNLSALQSALTNAIFAQHSIANLIKALGNQANAGLAHRTLQINTPMAKSA